MMMLNSDEGLALLAGMRQAIRHHLDTVDTEIGVDDAPWLDSQVDQLNAAREAHSNGREEVLNDIAILEAYVAFFRSYGILWRLISARRYSDSWGTLQDANDALRFIRRSSGLTLDPIVDQLSALESLYPYKIFASAGWVVEKYECSICGNDIDSFECSHRKGELYRGKRAYAIARNILHMDHIALVEHPADKRCVITIPDDAPGFSGVEYVADLLNQRRFAVSNFGGVSWGKRQVENSEYLKIGRNDLCHCLSGRKFKHCCIDKRFKEIDHAEILHTRSIFDRSAL